MRPDTREKYAEKGLVTEEAIIASWNRNGEVQRNRGTLMHFHIEQFLNCCAIGEPQSPEFQQFLKLFQRISIDQRAFRTELSVYSPQLNVAGQIDGLFLLRSDGTFALWDWKRSKLVFAFLFSQVAHRPEQTIPSAAVEYNSKDKRSPVTVRQSDADERAARPFTRHQLLPLRVAIEHLPLHPPE